MNEEAEKLGMNELGHRTPIVSKTCKKIVVKLLQYCLSMYGFLNLIILYNPLRLGVSTLNIKNFLNLILFRQKHCFFVKKHEDNLILMKKGSQRCIQLSLEFT